MSTLDPRIDEYISNAQDFAKPIMIHLREIIHETCSEVEEGWKWSFPNFMYKGKILCSMAAHKSHCSFGFWLEKEMKTMKALTKDREKDSMFSLGKIKLVSDLPTKVQLQKAIREAMKLTDMGVTIKKQPPKKTEVELPDYFKEELENNAAAKKVFDEASPSFRKEYILWITDAKTEATRNKRLQQAIEWISEGKGRNWKYEKC